MTGLEDAQNGWLSKNISQRPGTNLPAPHLLQWKGTLPLQ